MSENEQPARRCKHGIPLAFDEIGCLACLHPHLFPAGAKAPADWPTDARACLEQCRAWITDTEPRMINGTVLRQRDELLTECDRVLDAPQPDANLLPLGRLRLELKALGDAAAMRAMENDESRCHVLCGRETGKAAAYYHALDLVMALEREQ